MALKRVSNCAKPPLDVKRPGDTPAWERTNTARSRESAKPSASAVFFTVQPRTSIAQAACRTVHHATSACDRASPCRSNTWLTVRGLCRRDEASSVARVRRAASIVAIVTITSQSRGTSPRILRTIGNVAEGGAWPTRKSLSHVPKRSPPRAQTTRSEGRSNNEIRSSIDCRSSLTRTTIGHLTFNSRNRVAANPGGCPS